MNVLDVMTQYPVITESGVSLSAAIEQMRAVGCHHLPVMSKNRHLVGILSFHDCQRALGDLLAAPQPDTDDRAKAMRVADVMTPAPIVVEPDTPAHEAARLMLEHFIGCLPVMRGETLVGIVTRSDLLMAFMILSQRPDIPLAGFNQAIHQWSSGEK